MPTKRYAISLMATCEVTYSSVKSLFLLNVVNHNQSAVMIVNINMKLVTKSSEVQFLDNRFFKSKKKNFSSEKTF